MAKTRNVALRIAAIYMMFGILWITLSDDFLATFVQDVGTLTQFQSYKGWLYVLLTSVLVYFLVRQSLARQLVIEDQLRRECDRNQTYLDTVQTVMVALNAAGEITMINRAGCELLDYAERELLGRNWFATCLPQPEGMETLLPLFQRIMAGELDSAQYHENAVLCRDGTGRLIAWRNTFLYEHGQLVGTLSSGQDITLDKQIDEQLRIAAIAFESQEGMFVTDARGVILRVNQAFTRITGYSAEEAVGQNPRMLSSGQYDATFYTLMWRVINLSGKWEGEIWNRRKDGEIYPEYLIITAVKDAQGVVTNYVAALTDITLRKKSEEEIKHLAFFDQLTNLPNRRLLLDRLQQALALSARSGRYGALIFIDLDDFKILNDTLGHNMGDTLLKQIAQRLKSCVRDGDTTARLGGDEFMVALEDLSNDPIEAAAKAKTVSHKILRALGQPYALGQHEYHNNTSIGVTLFIGHQQPIEDLLKQADMAMYQAKNSGHNLLCFFDKNMQENINRRAFLETELRRALERQQFQLYYQIQVDHSGSPLGAEALIRWLHPERGLVSPAEFIPLAENTGLILAIGQWVVETACMQLKKWQKHEQTRDLVLAVNVSAKQFHQSDFALQIREAIQRHAINPKRLKLELTESLLLENVDETIATMNRLHELGVKFSLDDFGTGYSSLQYLKRLPLDQLKIDQTFVREIVVDVSDKAIVATVVAMAHSLNLDVIAEGVETEAQRQLLLQQGCERFQGYLFGRPLPIAEFEALLDTQVQSV